MMSPGTERAQILSLPNANRKFPFQPGYCAAGIVEKIGSEVTAFKVGDRVACSIGHRSIGNVDESWAVKIPDDVSFERGLFVRLGQIAMQGVRKARIELGENVMVIGLGVIGLLALQLASISGADDVIGMDLLENRLDIAKKCGATFTLNPALEGWKEKLSLKPQVVIESTGAPAAMNTALAAVRKFGRVILLGSTRGVCTVDFYSDVHCKGVNIIGAHTYHSVPPNDSYPGNWTWKDDSECFMKLLNKKKLKIDELITDTCKWQDIENVYKRLLEWDADLIGVIINWIS